MPPPSEAFGGGGPTYYSPADIPASFRFNQRNADDIFAEFFGVSSPFGGMGGIGRGAGGSGGMGVRLPNGMFVENMFGSFGDGGGSGAHVHHQSAPRKAPPIENKLPCALEDIYKGTTRKMKITREVIDVHGLVVVLTFLVFFFVSFCNDVFTVMDYYIFKGVQFSFVYC